MILRSAKRLTICSKEQNKTRKKQRVRPYLPDELIINDILIRLPARTLAICSCVSKLWYNSIFHDPKFTSSHFVENKNKLKLVFNLLNVFENGLEKAYFLSIEEKISKNTDFYYHKVIADISFGDTSEVVGYCNGLVCLNLVTEIAVINPTRGERLVFTNSFPDTMGCMYLCHGFGFDSLLQEYKVVFVYTTTMNEEQEEKLVCMVITLGGDNSWRGIVTSTAKISWPPGSSPLPSRMVTRPSRSTRRSATLCGGDMLWRITYTGDNNDESDMLLSFNIHNEKFQFIRLPPECCLTHTATKMIIDEHQCLVVDHHLLEFQGDLCVARTEKIMISDCHLQHRNHHSEGQEIFCCWGFKVHLYIMNDKVKQVWTKGKAFCFPVKDGLLPDPFCRYFSVTPPTRMLSYSDQLLTYWFDGLYLIFYSLQMEHPKVVRCFNSYDEHIQDIFDAKIKSESRSDVGQDDNKFFPYMDYQLIAQVENINSLQKLIPKGLKTTSTFSSYI